MNFYRPTVGTLLPPLRGSFPLDHDGTSVCTGECKEEMKVYLACIKSSRGEAEPCKEMARAYLACRMAKDLMAPVGWDKLGFVSADARGGGAAPAAVKDATGATADAS